jgi:hypothetical protein
MTTIQIRPTPVFERILDIPYDVCRDVALGAGLGLQRTSGAMTSAPVRIRRGLFRRHVPMQLRVEPWSVDGSATAVILAPLTRRRRTRRYFQAGHALLDDLSSEMRSPTQAGHQGIGTSSARLRRDRRVGTVPTAEFPRGATGDDPAPGPLPDAFHAAHGDSMPDTRNGTSCASISWL